MATGLPDSADKLPSFCLEQELTPEGSSDAAWAVGPPLPSSNPGEPLWLGSSLLLQSPRQSPAVGTWDPWEGRALAGKAVLASVEQQGRNSTRVPQPRA